MTPELGSNIDAVEIKTPDSPGEVIAGTLSKIGKVLGENLKIIGKAGTGLGLVVLAA